MVKPAIRPLKMCCAAIHVDAQIDGLPDAQVAQLRFLEVGVDPDFVERANRHQVLADLNIVAGIDVAARDDAVDLRCDIAVTKIQLGLREIALGGFEFRLGLLDGRGIGRELGERAVDVAQFFELVEHRFRPLLERVHDAELCGTLNELRLRLEDGRKGLVEIGRHLAEIAAPVRLRRQPQRDADLVDFGQGLSEFRASRRQRSLPPVVLRTRHIGSGDELLRPIEFNLRQRQRGLALVDSGNPRMQQSHLIVDVLHARPAGSSGGFLPALRSHAPPRWLPAGRLARCRPLPASRRPQPGTVPCPTRRGDLLCAHGLSSTRTREICPATRGGTPAVSARMSRHAQPENLRSLSVGR